MAVKECKNKNGNLDYQIYVNIRSKTDSSLRVQKKISGVKTLKEAKRREKELIRQCERELFEKEALGSTWGNVVTAWEKYLQEEGKVQETTRTDYVSSVKKYTYSWRNFQAASISTKDVREILGDLKLNSSSVSYQNKVKVILNRIFTFGIEHGLIKGMDRSPTYGINLGRIEEVKPEILTIQEIRTLLTEAKKLNHDWYLVWAMALLTGMRNGELYALLWTDIDWENNLLSVTKSYNTRRRLTKSTKSGCWRTIPISSELERLLKELKLQAGKRNHVLPRLTGWEKGSQAKVLRQFCIGLGLPSVKFHTLRACFATQLIRGGVPPIQIQKICGWKDLETMQRYVRLAGIETDGATEGLKILPEEQVTAMVVNLFTKK